MFAIFHPTQHNHRFMPVKQEILEQIQHAVANDAAGEPILQWADDMQKETHHESKMAAASRIHMHKQVHEGCREASEEWEKAEMALSQVLKSKKRMKDPHGQFRLPTFGGKPHTAPSAPELSGLDSEERSHNLAQSRSAAVLERARLMRCRAAEAGKKLKDHAKRRLRVKISEILREVHRRQNLRRHQEKVWTFRDEKHKMGCGPAASIGDADDFALGLGADEFEDATPRRRCILDSLSLEELDLVRSNPRWYLESMDSDFEDYEMSGNRERLIDFFTPARKDKNVSIECYAQRLRARLAAAEAQDLHDSVPSQRRSWQAFGESSGGLSQSYASLGRAGSAQTSLMQASTTSLPVDFSQMSTVASWRREPIRDDRASPTMQKVWEKHRRKEERDAQILESRRLAAEERMVRNAFNVSQQIRDYESTQSKYKELHQLRMAEALERKAARDAEAQERLAVLDEFKLRKMRRALDIADEQLELKRDRVTDGLQVWHASVRRCQRHARAEERKAKANLESSQEAYLARLTKVGKFRSEKMETQAQKNDKLKSRIQISLMQQLDEQRKLDCDRLALATEEKLEAARYRRYRNSNKYNFLERAFGEQVPFDHKFAYTSSLKNQSRLKSMGSKLNLD
eukprot:s2911_g11.t1